VRRIHFQHLEAHPAAPSNKPAAGYVESELFCGWIGEWLERPESRERNWDVVRFGARVFALKIPGMVCRA
jgi:hypothetical protein